MKMIFIITGALYKSANWVGLGVKLGFTNSTLVAFRRQPAGWRKKWPQIV
jgi:hypothetical protein